MSGSVARRYPCLDLLRVIAVVMTMLTHTPGVTERFALVRPFRWGLGLGVDLFMLISGWLLGGQLLRDAARRDLDPWRFYVRRWFRTLPPYYAVLAVLYYVTDGPDFAGPLPLRTVLTHVFFLQGYLRPNLFGVSWSLCVEEHFYLLLPAVVWLLGRRESFGATLALVFGLEAAAVLGRWHSYTGHDFIPDVTHLRCHGLFIGFLLAWVSLKRPEIWSKIGAYALPLGLAGIVGTLIVMRSLPGTPSPWSFIGAPTIATWTLAMIFVACVHDASSWSRVSFRGLQYAGELTYAVYLVHSDVPRAWLGGHADSAGVRGLVLRLFFVLLFSVVLHELVERPALRLRDRLLGRRQPVPVPG
jgi:peptidoglycan/LPS O-acetylase OafA/YrhL